MLQFLTHIPINIELDVTEEDFAKGAYFFTTIGVILGAILLLAYYLLNQFFQPLSMAVLLVFLHILATGGLHLDGLADASDGLFSNRSPERILEIMHDSRIGSNGVIALIFVIALKVIFTYEILLKGGWLYLLVVPVLGRYSIVLTANSNMSPLKNGMGNFFIGNINKWKLLFNSLIVLVLLIFLPISVGALIAVVIYTFVTIMICRKKIGGVTGDILGFNCENAEVVTLFILALLLR